MNTARTVTYVATLAALLGAAVMLQGSPAVAADAPATAQEIIDLTRVEIIVRRNVVPAMQIVELPRVVVTARRADTAATRIVELPRVVITARRGDGSTPTKVVQAQRSSPV